MPPATDPIPVLLLDNIRTSLAAINGDSNYYHNAKFGGIGRDIQDPAIVGYPALYIGEAGEGGAVSEANDRGALMHDHWYWDVPIFGVLNAADALTDLAGPTYKALLKLVADIHRALRVDHTRNSLAINTIIRSWTMLGPQDTDDARPWVAVLVRVIFRTRYNEMVSVPA